MINLADVLRWETGQLPLQEPQGGILHVLSICAGHLTFSFDTEEDAEKARKVIDDMIKRGYFFYVETSRGLRKVKGYHPKHKSYIIEGGADVPEAAALPAGVLQPTDAEVAEALKRPGALEEPGEPVRRRRGRPPKQYAVLPAKATKATSIAPFAGG